MSTDLLGDSKVQYAIESFLEEARICARCKGDSSRHVLGFAAMLTVLSCVVAVGETLLQQPKPHDSDCIGEFCKELDSSFPWLAPLKDNLAPLDRSKVAEKLCDVRNALVHALSLPAGTILLAKKASLTEYKQLPQYEWGILIPDFIDAVRTAIDDATKRQPNLVWDMTGWQKRRGREPAGPVSLTDQETTPSERETSSASSAL